jgi:hypothetical protein
MLYFEPHMAGKRVTAFTGNYGSGKTEVAVNFSLMMAEAQDDVRIADLDIVNPYFRCREATEFMEERGVSVVAPREGLRFADLPIILPEIKGMLENHEGTTVLDVGGDPVGARVLSSLAASFDRDELEVTIVLNANRPFTDTLSGCRKMIEDIEEASRLRVTSIVGNTHLMESTTPDVIREGESLVTEVARELGIPVLFLTVDTDLLEGWSGETTTVPVMPLTRHMAPPWLRTSKLGSEVFKL